MEIISDGKLIIKSTQIRFARLRGERLLFHEETYTETQRHDGIPGLLMDDKLVCAFYEGRLVAYLMKHRSKGMDALSSPFFAVTRQLRAAIANQYLYAHSVR